MYLHASIAVALAGAVIALGSVQACARSLPKAPKVAHKPNARSLALEPFYHQATWRNSRF